MKSNCFIANHSYGHHDGLTLFRNAYCATARYQEAIDAYKKAIELDPKNTQLSTFLKHAENLQRDSVLDDDDEARAGDTNGSSSGAAGAGAGGFDLESLMKNPALANMAKMFGGGGAAAGQGAGSSSGSNGGAGGGMPDLSGLMNNPQLMNM